MVLMYDIFVEHLDYTHFFFQIFDNLIKPKWCAAKSIVNAKSTEDVQTVSSILVMIVACWRL